ncbi:Arginase/deacetylase, partial [Stipitochalara longipes BDJ]
ITIVSVASEAGTHWGGQSKAPSALLNHGLHSKLSSDFAISLIDALPSPVLYSPEPLINGVRNENAVLEVMHSVKATISSLDDSTIPLIIGGDCSITPAILSALCNKLNKKIGILYFDGDVDLSLPATSHEPSDSDTSVLDSMVVSNLTQRHGSLASMHTFSRVDSNGNASPLVDNDNIVLFGFDPLQPKPQHWLYLLENGFKAFGAPSLRKDPKAAAKEAMTWLEDRCDGVFVHFDVDVISSAEFPLGNFPHYDGLAFEEAIAALKVFVASEKLVGLVITEVNPGNDGMVRCLRGLLMGLLGHSKADCICEGFENWDGFVVFQMLEFA